MEKVDIKVTDSLVVVHKAGEPDEIYYTSIPLKADYFGNEIKTVGLEIFEFLKDYNIRKIY
jgi:hypothetical protein